MTKPRGMSIKAANSQPILVTYRRRCGGQIHQAGFDAGERNASEALKYAWNSNSGIEKVEPLARTPKR